MTKLTGLPPDPHSESGMTLDAVAQPVCMLCGTTGEVSVSQLQDRHFDAPGSWCQLRCPDCKLVWLNPQPSERDLDKLYVDYYTHTTAREESLFVRSIQHGIPVISLGYDDIAIAAWERRWGALLARLGPLREMAARTVMGLAGSQRGRLLDFGCGDGAFLDHMRSLGWSVAGVEADVRAAEVASNRLEADLIHADLDTALDANPGGFDAVTMSHVIEHLLDPLATLRACADVLRPGGTLVIATPNTASRGHRQFGRNWLHLDPPRHIHLFDTNTLSSLVRRAGYRVERVETPSSSSHFVHQASRLLERRGTLPGIRVEGVGALERVASALFWMREYTLTRFGMMCGEEVLLTAVKPDGASG